MRNFIIKSIKRWTVLFIVFFTFGLWSKWEDAQFRKLTLSHMFDEDVPVRHVFWAELVGKDLREVLITLRGMGHVLRWSQQDSILAGDRSADEVLANSEYFDSWLKEAEQYMRSLNKS